MPNVPRPASARLAEASEIEKANLTIGPGGEPVIALDGEEYRRVVTLQAGGETDGLVCAECGVPVAHEAARMQMGLQDADKNPLPPLAFCRDHSDDDTVVRRGRTITEMPKAARSFYSKLAG